MSFKLFTLQTFGKLKPTEKIEAQRTLLEGDYQEFKKVEGSDELKEFEELKQWVNSDDFKNRKKEIESIRFKGSQEQKQLLEFQKLEKQKKIKNYFTVEQSSEIKRFETIKQSDKLAEYYLLHKYVFEGPFQEEKKNSLKQVFKGSPEQKQLLEYNKLQKSKAIKVYFELNDSPELKQHEVFANSETLKNYIELKNTPAKGKEQKIEFKQLSRNPEIKKYFRFEKSKKLKLYHSTVNSHQLSRFTELSELINSKEFIARKTFLEDKTKFTKTEAFQKEQKLKQLSADGDVKFYLAYEKSKNYKNYIAVADSADLKRHNELKQLINSEEFLAKKAYLEDLKKWEKTEEFAKQQKFLEMEKYPHLVKYFSYVGTTKFSFFEQWKVIFEDNFNGSKLDTHKWQTKHHRANDILGDNFSQPGDLQAYNAGKNLVFGTKGLSLQVKKENAEGKAWNPAVGFTPQTFNYTSDMINTSSGFWFENGILEAKIKFNPVTDVVSFFQLSGEKPNPQINLLEMGNKNRVGVFKVENGKALISGPNIDNLKKGYFYLFRIEKNQQQLIWSINDCVIYTMPASGFQFATFLNLSTIVVNEVRSSMPVSFDVEWVKCYAKKSV